MPRLPVVVLLTVSILACGCRGPGEVNPPSTTEQAALQQAWAVAGEPGSPPPSEGAHPVREWIAQHPWTTGFAVAALVVVGVVVGGVVVLKSGAGAALIDWH
jgi:hypothetical protein